DYFCCSYTTSGTWVF
nr:immunoglobulin light chain junction region [Macaca mulatta]MOV95113.1 immunoglobulin light chain junction region [Macaca mulatta]MOV95469.1 immunoglobulin light chain junction region [Macaca mulatta]MOV96324.1 immunoglobulin light chain junction region [Macaca mulatta]MOV96761.1 immunoglobulin light chain junction region [Macaca mulatta]